MNSIKLYVIVFAAFSLCCHQISCSTTPGNDAKDNAQPEPPVTTEKPASTTVPTSTTTNATTNGTTTPTTPSTTPSTPTTPPTTTTTVPPNSTTTVAPNSTTTVPPSTTSSTTPIPKPTTTPTPAPSNSTTVAPSTSAPATTTAAPSKDRQFDGPSFIGGIVLTLGLSAIAFIAVKFYKARTERNYHTL